MIRSAAWFISTTRMSRLISTTPSLIVRRVALRRSSFTVAASSALRRSRFSALSSAIRSRRACCCAWIRSRNHRYWFASAASNSIPNAMAAPRARWWVSVGSAGGTSVTSISTNRVNPPATPDAKYEP